jgi:hypothetical protein
LPAIVVVVIVVIVVMIVVLANPPCGTITITNTIAIAAPGGSIFGSTMAMALLFLGGGQ